MSLNFHYAVHTYVDNWVVCDREAREVLGFGSGTSPTDKEACEQLKKVATFYSVARNFKKVEVECERLSPVWDALKKISEPTSDEEAKECVNKLVESLKPKYGRELSSAASKFLWMRFGHPIIIYDSLTWKWMCKNGECLPSGKYVDFYNAWRTNFDNHQKEIDAACEELLRAQVRKFLCPSEVTDEEFEDAVSSPWFAERCFDHAVVNEISVL